MCSRLLFGGATCLFVAIPTTFRCRIYSARRLFPHEKNTARRTVLRKQALPNKDIPENLIGRNRNRLGGNPKRLPQSEPVRNVPTAQHNLALGNAQGNRRKETVLPCKGNTSSLWRICVAPTGQIKKDPQNLGLRPRLNCVVPLAHLPLRSKGATGSGKAGECPDTKGLVSFYPGELQRPAQGALLLGEPSLPKHASPAGSASPVPRVADPAPDGGFSFARTESRQAGTRPASAARACATYRQQRPDTVPRSVCAAFPRSGKIRGCWPGCSVRAGPFPGHRALRSEGCARSR